MSDPLRGIYGQMSPASRIPPQSNGVAIIGTVFKVVSEFAFGSNSQNDTRPIRGHTYQQSPPPATDQQVPPPATDPKTSEGTPSQEAPGLRAEERRSAESFSPGRMNAYLNEFQEKFKEISGLDVHPTDDQFFFVFKKTMENPHFTPPLFFQADRAVIDKFRADNNLANGEFQMVACHHLIWLLARDVLAVAKPVWKACSEPKPQFPFSESFSMNFSSLDETEKEASGIKNWAAHFRNYLKTITFLDLSHLELSSVPDFIPKYCTSLQRLVLTHNQLSALPLSLAQLPATCRIEIDNNSLDPGPRTDFDDAVTSARKENPSRGPQVIETTTRDAPSTSLPSIRIEGMTDGSGNSDLLLEAFRNHFKKIGQFEDYSTDVHRFLHIFRLSKTRIDPTPDFIKKDQDVIEQYKQGQVDPNTILLVANNHLRWLLAWDMIDVIQDLKYAIGQRFGFTARLGSSTPIIRSPTSYSSIEEVEEAAIQCEQWATSYQFELSHLESLNLKSPIVSLPEFIIKYCTSLKYLHIYCTMLNTLPLSLAQLTSTCLILLNYHGVFRESVAAFETETNRVRERDPKRGPRLYILVPDEMEEIMGIHRKAREEAIKATERDSRLFQEIGIVKWS